MEEIVIKPIVLEIGDRKIDVVKIMEQFCYIIDKEGNKRLLKLKKVQKKFLKIISEDWNAKKPLRYIILKARQMGFSTVINAFINIVTLFQPYQKSAIVADCAENASSLFEMTKFMYDSFPDKLLPSLKKNNGRLLQTEDTGSSVRILCVGENTGRSKSLQWLHLSEFAFWTNAEKTMVSLTRTVLASNPRSAVFIESTANGYNAFKKRWDLAVGTADSPYTPLFFAWFEDEQYRIPFDNNNPLTMEEIELKQRYGLDNDQIQFRRYQISEMCGDVNAFKQEYPSCPEEAFLATGSSVFDNEQVIKRKMTIENKPKRGYFAYSKEHSIDGNRITLSNIHWVDHPKGEISIYRQPISGFPYVLGGDPANGGGDAFVGQMINNRTKEQVAIYRKIGVDADLYAYQLYCLGKMYNWALIGTETNVTSSVMKTLAKCQYPRLYKRVTEDTIDRDVINSYGVKTTTITKPIMLDTFKAVFRENPLVINDYTTLCEMETFIVSETASGRDSMKAENGEHDDCVMAYAIALFVSTQQTTIVESSGNEKETIDSFIARAFKEKEEREKEWYSWLH